DLHHALESGESPDKAGGHFDELRAREHVDLAHLVTMGEEPCRPLLAPLDGRTSDLARVDVERDRTARSPRFVHRPHRPVAELADIGTSDPHDDYAVELFNLRGGREGHRSVDAAE